jgi:hypothetical protein
LTDKYFSSDDIYKSLVEDSNENWLYGLVAFALIEEERIEWASHYAEHNNGPPTADEIRDWYEQKPPGSLLRVKGTAENSLQIYSSEAVDGVLDDFRDEVQNGVILKELRRRWPNIWVSMLGGFIGTVIFAIF